MASKRAKLMWTPVHNIQTQTMPDGRVKASAGGKETFAPTLEQAVRTLEQQLQQDLVQQNY